MRDLHRRIAVIENRTHADDRVFFVTRPSEWPAAMASGKVVLSAIPGPGECSPAMEAWMEQHADRPLTATEWEEMCLMGGFGQ